MKKRIKRLSTVLIITLAHLLIFTSTFGQSPEKMTYQAVIRDADDKLLPEYNVGIQITILKDSLSGTAVYVERHFPTTNANGLVTLEIGEGLQTTTAGFADIDWSDGSYFIKTETDLDGGANYTLTNTTRFLSVPYAFHATTADSVTGTLNETDPVFEASVAFAITEADTANWNNPLEGVSEEDSVFMASVAGAITAEDTTYWNNKVDSIIESDPVFEASVAFSITEADTANWNNPFEGVEEQDPVFTAAVASQITAEDTTYWNSKVDNIVEADPVFEASVAATIDGTDTLYWNSKLDAEIDGDTINEIQTISRTGLTVTLSKNGGTYTDSVNVYTAGTGIDITNNVVSAKTYTIGEVAQGGIVFWVDETGQHGLVCAKTDQSAGLRWYAGTDGHTRAYGDGPLSGEMNTAIIIASQVAIGDDGGDYAARICAEWKTTEGGKTYGNWYLPSEEELDLMYQHKATIDAVATTSLATSSYWSSTEASDTTATSQDFSSGTPANSAKSSTYYVRAVRAF